MTRVFLYGTLKQGQSLHYAVEGQVFLGHARTEPRYRLFSLGTYPGMVPSEQGLPIEGEVWEVDGRCLRNLDEIEGVAEGEYDRAAIPLQAPFDDEPAYAYIYLGDITGLGDCGTRW